MDWKECCNKKIVKESSVDYDLIKSLVRKSDNKLGSENKLFMSEITAVSKISLAYDSLRELLEALALKHGYKIYNHECYTSFLKENQNGDEFDDLRKIRNAVNYYEKDVLIEEAKEIIKRIKNLRKSMSNLLNE